MFKTNKTVSPFVVKRLQGTESRSVVRLHLFLFSLLNRFKLMQFCQEHLMELSYPGPTLLFHSFLYKFNFSQKSRLAVIAHLSKQQRQREQPGGGGAGSQLRTVASLKKIRSSIVRVSHTPLWFVLILSNCSDNESLETIVYFSGVGVGLFVFVWVFFFAK